VKKRIPWNKGKKRVQGWSEERKKKMSQRMTGKKNPMYGKRITGSKHHMYGKHPSEETRKRISEGGIRRFKRMKHPRLGIPHSEESKQKMSQALKGKIPWIKGKKHSNATKQKMSESKKQLFASGYVPYNKGKSTGDETRKKLSEAQKKRYAEGAVPWNKGKKGVQTAWNKGKPASEESKKRMSIAQKKKYAMGFTGRKGTKHSEASKRKMSKSIRKVYADGFEVWNKGKPMRESTRQKLIARYTPELREQKRKWRLGKVYPQHATDIEIIVHKLLKSKGIKFEEQKEYIERGLLITGQPDIFIEPNICIFCDGDFWHGWKYLNGKRYDNASKLNNEYFEKKIASDKKKTRQLKEQGYVVRRFWGHDIKQKPESVLQEIIEAIKEARK
jgi:DNA mismatch endonuclease (patch repair protein)